METSCQDPMRRIGGKSKIQWILEALQRVSRPNVLAVEINWDMLLWLDGCLDPLIVSCQAGGKDVMQNGDPLDAFQKSGQTLQDHVHQMFESFGVDRKCHHRTSHALKNKSL